MTSLRARRHDRPALPPPLTRWASAAALGAALIACTSIGTGEGQTRNGTAPSSVHFTWTSKDGGNSGIMTATLTDGMALTGPFVQPTSETRIDSLEPLWMGWRRDWDDWGPWDGWGGHPQVTFVTRYSGTVVANLKGPGVQRLRCRFHLNAPNTGMKGGGQGECQSNDGKITDAVFSGP